MKRCPECDSRFPDTDKFCELDGTPLVADYSDSEANLLVPPAHEGDEPGVPGSGEPLESETDSEEEMVGAGGYRHSRDARPGQNWKILGMVAVAGVAIGIVLFIVYQRITREASEQSSNESSNEAVTQQQGPVLPSRASPFASESPSPEPSPSPSVTPSPSPAAQTQSPRVALSSSPVSTGGDGKTRLGPVTIRLTDGTSVEAEEVWETVEGIWYRRRGIVTLLDRNQVKAIEKPSPPPSPSASPATSSGTSR
jgi:cytoskeletal protein RodZ